MGLPTEIRALSEFESQMRAPRRVKVAAVPTAQLQRELGLRAEIAPVLDLGKKVRLEAKAKGLKLKKDRFLVETNNDALGRTELFFGYNVSDMTYEQILTEDKLMAEGKLPPRQSPRIVWTARLCIYDGKMRMYHGAGEPQLLNNEIGSFVNRIQFYLQSATPSQTSSPS